MARHNDKNIKEVMQDLLIRNQRLASGFYSVRIEDIWKEQMGPVISRYTKSVVLKGKVLRVSVDSAPLRKELSMGKEKILENINKALGSQMVEEVIVS